MWRKPFAYPRAQHPSCGPDSFCVASLPRNARLILELGAWRGQTTRFLAETYPHAKIIAVDTWYGGEFRQPDHPDWKGMLPWVWDSFAARMGEIRERVIPMRQRPDEAVREVAASGMRPDMIFFDPDYNSRLLRETLAAILRYFPNVPLAGHDWLWHGVQREVSLAARHTGRQLDAQGNLWQLAPVAQRMTPHALPSSNGHVAVSLRETKESGHLAPRDVPQIAQRNGSHLAERDGYKVLVTIPHFYREQSSRLYGSGTDPRDARVAAVQACLAALYETVAGEDSTANLTRPENLRANTATTARLDVVICTSGRDHLLDEIEPPPFPWENRSVRGDPRLLGYACHEVLRDRLGDYDYYVYLEDDLVLTDTWAFAKLRWFCEMLGPECLLQPNRYELTR